MKEKLEREELTNILDIEFKQLRENISSFIKNKKEEIKDNVNIFRKYENNNFF